MLLLILYTRESKIISTSKVASMVFVILIPDTLKTATGANETSGIDVIIL